MGPRGTAGGLGSEQESGLGCQHPELCRILLSAVVGRAGCNPRLLLPTSEALVG